MILADIVLPSCGTTGRTGNTIVDTVLEVQIAYALKTLVGDDIVAEYVEVLLDERTEILAELLDILDEVRVNISLQSTYSVIVLDESSTGCLLHDVQHLLTVTHAVKECCQSREVLSTCTEEEQVVVETLEFIHDCADVLDTVVELNAHSLLDNAD